MNLLKKLASDTAIYGISSILSRLLNWVILTPYLTRVLGQKPYGIISDLYVWTALVLVVLTFRMETALFRFGSRKKDLNTSFSTAFFFLGLLSFCFVLLGISFIPKIAHWLSYQDTPDYIFWFILIIGLDSLSALPFAKLRLLEKPTLFALLKTGAIIINILMVYFFLELCPWLLKNHYAIPQWIYSSQDPIIYLFKANFLASLLVLLFLLPTLFNLKWKPNWVLLKKMVVYSSPLVLAGIAGIVNQLIGIPLLKEKASPDLDYNLQQAGLYSAASKIAVLMALFTQAFNYAAEPFFFKNAPRAESKQLYGQIGQYFTLVGSITFLSIVLFIDYIQFFLGENFRSGLHIVPILLMANLFLGLYYNFSVWFKLTDRTDIGGKIAIVGSLITLTINLYFIPLIGIAAPAWASFFCYGFMAGASFLLGKKYYPIQYPIKKMAFYLFFTILVYLGYLGYKNLIAPYWLLPMNAVILTLTTLLFLWVDKIFKRINILQ